MRNFIFGFFGIWIVLITVILSPGTSQRAVLAASGIAIALVALWPARPRLGGGGPTSSRDNHMTDHV